MAFEYARANVAKINIFFNDPAIKKVVRDIKLSRIMFTANVGGILGLAMGASVITLFEVLYHLCRLLVLATSGLAPKIRRSLIP